VEIQKEILFNGPVVANIKAPHYFLVYKEGILVNDESANSKLIELDSEEGGDSLTRATKFGY